jgi:hypothetical protein
MTQGEGYSEDPDLPAECTHTSKGKGYASYREEGSVVPTDIRESGDRAGRCSRSLGVRRDAGEPGPRE